jgi:EAL and modified HD-GYP domain-containing signal transduction protein
MSDIFVARQPIYDRDLEVFAYDLLFSSGNADAPHREIDSEAATSTVIVNTFASMGLTDLVGNRPAAMTVSKSFLLDAGSLQLPAERLILELHREVQGDDEVLAALGELKMRGYTIALDDFVATPERQPLLELADIVKLDIQALGQQALWQHSGQLQGGGAKLVAKRVETHEELDFCRNLGFEYYQGQFLCQPKLVTKRTVPANRMAKLAMLAELNRPDADFDSLEKLIGRDVGLSYRFLRYINSAFFSLPHKVGSIRQALVLLGIAAVRKWATLLAMADLDDKPNELIVTALVRGKMCELAAASRPTRERDEYFTAGMFSVIDALLDSPMDVVLSSLPLQDDLKDALHHHLGPKGVVLSAVLNYERARFEDLRALAPPGVSAQEIYQWAITWAREASAELEAASRGTDGAPPIGAPAPTPAPTPAA